MAPMETGLEFTKMASFSGTEKRTGGDRRSGLDRRMMQIDFDGEDRRTGDRRTGVDRRQRRAERRRRT